MSYHVRMGSINKDGHSQQAIGVVMATTHAEGPISILPVLVGDAGAVPHDPPPWAQSPDLLAQRQWYLFRISVTFVYRRHQGHNVPQTHTA